MARFCPACGTEVDDNALFCPTCGQAIDQGTEAEIPPAPSWPEPMPGEGATAGEPVEPPEELPPAWEVVPPRRAREAQTPEAVTQTEAPQAASPPPPPSSPPPPVAPPPAQASPTAGAGSNLPFTTPLMLSGWLIGGGAIVGAVGALVSLFDRIGVVIDLLLLVGLVVVAARIFGEERIPEVPHLRLGTLVIVLIAFGVALGRLAIGAAGAGDLLVFLGTAAAAIGAIILELGRDQPMGGAA